MIFDKKKSSFGRHETFHLRYSWLTKGFQSLQEGLQKGKNVFNDPDATLQLGVGKNMVHSIRHWLLAAQIIKKTQNGYETTHIGNKIFGSDGFDVYLEDEATIWLIHWLITSNPAIATSWYWFFNHFRKPHFTHNEMVDALEVFVKKNLSSKCAIGTLKKDVDIILRMYSRSKKGFKHSLEDSLDSPFSSLGLISHAENSKSYYSYSEDRTEIPTGIVGFAIANIFKETNTSSIPIENLIHMKGNHPAIGAIFRMTEDSLLAKLEILSKFIPNVIEIRETAGIHQIHRLEAISAMTYLEKHYHDSEAGSIS